MASPFCNILQYIITTHGPVWDTLSSSVQLLIPYDGISITRELHGVWMITTSFTDVLAQSEKIYQEG